MPELLIRVIPLVELDGAFVNEPIDGASTHNYGYSKRNPDPLRRSQVFPHPAVESEGVIQRWLADWPKARFDVFQAERMLSPAGADFVVQVRESLDEPWRTVEASEGLCGFRISIAGKTNGQSGGSCPPQAGSIPAPATSSDGGTTESTDITEGVATGADAPAPRRRGGRPPGSKNKRRKKRGKRKVQKVRKEQEQASEPAPTASE